MQMDVYDGSEIIKKAMEKQAEDKAFQLYLTRFGDMTEETYMPFEKFYNPNSVEEEQKTADEILADVKELLNSTEWR